MEKMLKIRWVACGIFGYRLHSTYTYQEYRRVDRSTAGNFISISPWHRHTMKISVFPEQETLRPSPIMNDEAEKSTGEVEYIKKTIMELSYHPLGNYQLIQKRKWCCLLHTSCEMDSSSRIWKRPYLPSAICFFFQAWKLSSNFKMREL